MGLRIGEAGSTQLPMLRKPKEVLQRALARCVSAAVCLSSMATPRLVSGSRCDQVLPALSWPCTRRVAGPCLSLGSAQCGPRVTVPGLGMLGSCGLEMAEFTHISPLFLAGKFYQPWCFSVLSSPLSPPSHGGNVSPRLRRPSSSRVRKRSCPRAGKR